MAKIEYEFPCPACGKLIRGQRKAKEFKKDFQCKKCTRTFSVTFDYPDRAKLEDDFLNDRLPPDIIPRAGKRLQEGFPFRLFSKKGRKNG